MNKHIFVALILCTFTASNISAMKREKYNEAQILEKFKADCSGCLKTCEENLAIDTLKLHAAHQALSRFNNIGVYPYADDLDLEYVNLEGKSIFSQRIWLKNRENLHAQILAVHSTIHDVTKGYFIECGKDFYERVSDSEIILNYEKRKNLVALRTAINLVKLRFKLINRFYK